MIEPANQRLDASGVGFAITFLLAGGLCIFAPEYFDASGWRETAWHITGLMFAVIGGIGLASELSKVSGRATLSDLAVGLVLLFLALGLALSLAAWSPPSPFLGMLRGLVAFLVFFGIYGCAAGVIQAVQARRLIGTPPPRPRDQIIALAVALLGLTTAVINVLAAFGSVGGR